MAESIVIVPYEEDWPREFGRVGGVLRQALGGLAVRIDHIGSTSIIGLDAKPIIDIQVSVKRLEPVSDYRTLLESAGFVHRAANPDRTKRYFRESPGDRRTHIHVRESGSWSEQFALLFRDYLRGNHSDRALYAAEKYRLAGLYRGDREKYAEEKGPVIWSIMRRASDWSQLTGWRPGESGC